MSLTNDEIKKIMDDAPDGATHYGIGGEWSCAGYSKITEKDHLEYKDGRWIEEYLECCDFDVEHNLSDLREILELRERVAELEQTK